MKRRPTASKGQARARGADGIQDPERAARCLQALAHPTRLRILAALSRGERTVTELRDQVGGAQSNLSQHLRLMRDRGILTAKKDGARVFYAVADPRILKLLDTAKEAFCRE